MNWLRALRPPQTLLYLLVPLAVYLALALPQLTLPGLHNDEAAEAGLPAEQILAGQPITAFRDAGLPVGDRTLPWMVQDYIGAFNVYFLLPFFAVLGPTVVALRVYTVLIGAITLGFTFAFVAETVSRRAAFIAALLLAASPSFIFWQRQGVFVTSLTATLAMAALWAGAVWAKRGGGRWAALIGLLCGAGLYAKLLFIWIIGGMVGALALINLPMMLKLIYDNRRPNGASVSVVRRLGSVVLFPRSPTRFDLIAFSLGLLLGLAPLLAYNLQTGGTLLSIGTNLTTSYYGVNNLNFFGNLNARLDHFRAVIAGRDHLWYLGGSFGNELWESALSLSALVIGGRWLFRRQRAQLPAALLLLLILGVLQSSFTVSGLFPTHFAIFAPLWPLLIALAGETILNPFYEPLFLHITGPNLSMLLGNLARGWWGFLNIGIVLVIAGLGTLFVRDVAVTIQYQAALQTSGGLGPHSDAIYRLIDYLNENAPTGTPVVAMDWGFAPQVQLLTQGRVQPDEIFGYSRGVDEGFNDRLQSALDQPAALFIFHVSQETIFPRREAFEAQVKARGWQPLLQATIARRDGAPLFEIVTVRR